METINDIGSALYLMGNGMRLRIPKDGTEPMLVEGLARFGHHRPSEPIAPEAVSWLLGSGLIAKLTEQGEGQRAGWRDAGYDGDVADWYVCTQ
jgi:hypothetical protein